MRWLPVFFFASLPLAPIAVVAQSSDILAEGVRARVDCFSPVDCGPDSARRPLALERAAQVAGQLDQIVVWLAENGLDIADHDTYKEQGRAVAIFGDAQVCMNSKTLLGPGDKVMACAATYEKKGGGANFGTTLQAKFPSPVVMGPQVPGQKDRFQGESTEAHEMFHTLQYGVSSENIAFSEATAAAAGMAFDRWRGRKMEWSAPYYQTSLDGSFSVWNEAGYGFAYYLHFLAEERQTPDRIDFLRKTLQLRRHSGPKAIYDFAYGPDVGVYTPDLVLPYMAAKLNAPYRYPPGHQSHKIGDFAWFFDVPRKTLKLAGDGTSAQVSHVMQAMQTSIQPLHLFATGKGSRTAAKDQLYWLEVTADFTGPAEADLRLVFEHEVIKGNSVARMMRDTGTEQDIGFVRVVNAPADGNRIGPSAVPVTVTAKLSQPELMPDTCVTLGQPYRVFDRIPEGAAGPGANWRLDTDNGVVDNGVVIPDRLGDMTIGLTLQAIPTRVAYSVDYVAPKEQRIVLGKVRVVPDGCSVRMTMGGNGTQVVMTYSPEYDTTEILAEDGTRVFLTKDRMAFWQQDTGFIEMPPEIASDMGGQMLPIDPDELAVFGDTVEDRLTHLPLLFAELFSIDGAQSVADGAASSETLTRQTAPAAARRPASCPHGGTGCEAFTATAFGRAIATVTVDDTGRARRVILTGGTVENAFEFTYGDFDIFPPPWPAP